MSAKISWIKHEKHDFPVVYDSDSELIILPLFNYAFYLYSRHDLKPTYVKNETYHLITYHTYLCNNKKTFIDSTEYMLKKFRDDDLRRMKLKSRSSDSSLKAVMNGKLIRIYHFLSWLQHDFAYEGLIGPTDCQVKSTLNLENKKDRNPKTDYPLLYKLRGARSKHFTRHAPGFKETERLTEYFTKNFTPYLSQRNILLMEIALQMGLRRASINSLRCEQFSDAIIDGLDNDKLPVIPDSQKFDYRIPYEFPFTLALRINSFINGPRKALIERLRIFEDITQDRIFLSARSGAPLCDRTISTIFGEAFDEIGVNEARISIHSLRRTYTKAESRRQIQGRIENKLDTSDASINAAIALRLGQRDPKSTAPYITSTQLDIIEEGNAKNNAELAAMKEEIIRLNTIILKLSE